MKIQLDTINKTIKIEESIKLSDLVKELDALLPNRIWYEFKLEVGVITYWGTYPRYIVNPCIPLDPYPWYQPKLVECGTSSSD